VNVATSTEPVWTDRSRAWQDRYARYLLEQLEADPARLTAAHAAALHNLREAKTLRFARNAYRARLRHGAPPRTAAQILSSHEARELVAVHDRAVDLCRLALAIATATRDVEGDQDPRARQGLLAATRHHHCPGAAYGFTEASSHKLARELNTLDLSPRRQDGARVGGLTRG
jgi:hypothetical protein